MGRRHRPFFRINAVESRAPRDGRILEKLGHYDPIEKDTQKQVVLDRERIEYWLGKGAIPSDTVSEILLRHGIKHKYAEDKAARMAKAKAIANSKGKFFTKAQKIAAEKEIQAKAEAQAKAKEEAEAKAKAEEEAKKKAEEEKAKAEAAEAQTQEQPEAKAEETPAEEKPQAQ